jgi:three-Cys-motif partner protein
VYIEDTKETVLGSAGHALELKTKTQNTANLKVILIENNPECYHNLREVIKRRWPTINLKEAEGAVESNTSGIYLINKNLEEALTDIDSLYLGNSLYFFDPLRSVEYKTISEVASKRMRTPFKTGTEFFIFSFTSDWFLGRDDIPPLPTTTDKDLWSIQETRTVQQADELFGSNQWRKSILVGSVSIKESERLFIRLYKNRLHRWFRYILPLPFNPKNQQLFHLILCSNYEAGVRRTRDAYSSITGNPKYSPSNEEALLKFRKLHPTLFLGIIGNRRPLEWRILWKIIKQHEGSLCDYRCNDLIREETDKELRVKALHWLLANDYLKLVKIDNAWEHQMRRYRIKWSTVKSNLEIEPPPKLRPISPQQLKLTKLQTVEED